MPRNLPPLTALRAFEAAARHLSFTRAAGELHVTQAAVSHQVKALEEHLSIALFVRRGRAVALSEAGQVLLPPVRSALDLMADGCALVRSATRQGIVLVTVAPSFAGNWLVGRLPRFNERHPDIEVRISATHDLIDFSRDDADLGIRTGTGNWPGDLRIDRLMTEDLFPVCSPKLLEHGPPLREPADLNHHTLLHDMMEEDWRTWLRAAGAEDVNADRGPRFNYSEHVLTAAIRGQGVALGRSVLVTENLAAGELIRPFDISLPAEFAYYVVSLKATADRTHIRAFREWILEEAEAHMARDAELRHSLGLPRQEPV
jgi:LysR family glycine cleavage system transcriptional activator